jgi:tetratricopeptide (TPR) repeat protein
MDRKDYSGAARIYEQILRTYPNSFQALSNLGVADAQMGKYPQAAKAYGRALRLQPNSFPLLLNLGLAYFKAGDSRSAVKPLQHAVAVQPDSFQARSLLAMSYYSQKEFSPASREFEKLIAAQPDNSTLQYLLAESYLWSGQEQQMLDFFRHVLERSPNSVTVHMLMGEADDGLGRTDEAIKEFEAAAAALAPQQPNVHFGLGYLYWEERQYDRAAIEFQREIDAGGSVAKSKAYLGDIALHQGNQAQARTLLEEAARSFPKYRLTHYDLGVLETQEKNYDDAVSELHQAIELDPKRADAHYRLAEVFRAQGKAKLAQEELDKVAQIQASTRENLLHEISGSPPQTPEP